MGIALLVRAAAADDPKTMSSRLSDEAFALLTSVSSSHGSPSPMLGPVGVFAGDAQKLSSALQSGDRTGAGAAMAALKADAAAVDKAAGSGGPNAAKWAAIKHDLDALSASVPAASVPAAPAAAVAAESVPSAASATAPAAAAEVPSGPPKVRIESAQMVGADVLQVKGYMSGRSLRSAGIYLGEDRLAKLDVKRVAGEQMIRFDLQIHRPTQGSVLRVYDSAGRMAQAPILGDAAASGPVVEPGPPIGTAPPTSLDSDDKMASTGGDDFGAETSPPPGNPVAGGASEGNTEEIPAAAPPPSGPKRRMRSHLRARGPNDVHITINDLTAVDPGLHEYMVRGQISGSDLERAGIYVDGRLAQEIPLNSGGGLRTSDFAQSFTAVGSEATIRVYRTRRDYSETSINLTTAGTGAATGPVAINSTLGGAYGGYVGGVNPGQLAVQITSVQAAAPSLYVVSGIITGHNIASAGIYQNGMLAQPLNVNGGGGLGGLISGLIPGMSRQVSFVGRFNPAQGYATVRAYDSSGMMAEQPIIAGGTAYGVNPYGAVNSYGGVNPYMTNPYTGMGPYGAGVGVGGTGIGVGVAPGVGASPRTSAGAGLGSVPW